MNTNRKIPVLNSASRHNSNGRPSINTGRLSYSAFKAPASGVKSALKTTLFTPQAQRSSSHAFGSHSSSKKTPLSSGSSRLPITEDRPLSDKSYHEQCIGRLVEFLGSAPEAKIARVFSSSMSARDVEIIFKYLLNLFGFTLTTPAYETEVQRILKELGYPFQVNKSAFQSISTPKARGTVLGMMDWLVDCLKYFHNTNVEKMLFDQESDDDFNVQKELLRMCVNNDLENDSQQLSQIALNKFGSVEQIQELMTQIGMLEVEWEQMNEQVKQESLLPKSVQELRSAVDELKRYTQEMNEYLQNSQKKQTSLETERKQLEESLESLEKELQDVQNQVRSQTVHVEDVEMTNKQTQQFESEIISVESEISHMRNIVCELNLQTSQKCIEIQRQCCSFLNWYADFDGRLKSPAMKRFSGELLKKFDSPDFKLILDGFEKPINNEKFTDLIANAMSFFKHFKHALIDLTNQLNRELATAERQAEDAKGEQQTLNEKIQFVKNQLHELESQLSLIKTNYRAEKKKIEEENVILEKKISKVVAEIKTAEEKKEKLFQNECEKVKEEYSANLQRARGFLAEMTELDELVDKVILETKTVVSLQKRTEFEIKKAEYRNEKFKMISEKKFILKKKEEN